MRRRGEEEDGGEEEGVSVKAELPPPSSGKGKAQQQQEGKEKDKDKGVHFARPAASPIPPAGDDGNGGVGNDPSDAGPQLPPPQQQSALQRRTMLLLPSPRTPRGHPLEGVDLSVYIYKQGLLWGGGEPNN